VHDVILWAPWYLLLLAFPVVIAASMIREPLRQETSRTANRTRAHDVGEPGYALPVKPERPYPERGQSNEVKLHRPNFYDDEDCLHWTFVAKKAMAERDLLRVTVRELEGKLGSYVSQAQEANRR
jgi:hypothetical protein